MTDDNILELSPRSRPEDVEAAQKLLDQQRMVLSSNEYQPKIAWTLHPWRESELRQRIEAGGSAPFVVHAILPLPRSALQWPGAPFWAMYGYLVMCEVRATFGR